MAKFIRTYPTDLKYTEWLLLLEYFPHNKMGRPRTWEYWQIIDAILYVNRTGCQWRMLPKDLPPWQTVSGYYWRWNQSELWERINAVLVRQVRQSEGRDSQPSAAIIDSQSVRLRKVAKSVELTYISRRLGANDTLWWMFWDFCCWLWFIVQESRMELVDTRPCKNCLPASNATFITAGVA